METYSLMRQFADSWALLALVVFFVGVIFFVFRPGSRRVHDDAADSIFRHEQRPVGERDDPRRDAEKEGR